MYFFYSFLSILSVLVLLIPGFILRKLRILSDTAAKDMSSVLLYVGIPALTFHCMMSVDISMVDPAYVVLAIVAAVVIHFLSFGLIKLLFIRDRNEQAKASSIFAAVFSNCGFLGIPFTEMAINNCPSLTAVATETVHEALFYVTIYNIVFNIISWTLGLGIYCKGEKTSVILKKSLLSPVMISTAVCLPFLLTGVSLLEPIVIGEVKITQIGNIIEFLYNICVPLSMVILGTRLADVKFSKLFKSSHAYVSGAVKLVLTPVIALLILLLTDVLYKLDIAFLMAFVVMAGTPSATNGLAFAERYGGDTETAGICILLSTIASVLTLPLILLMTAGIYLG